ncbi:MAG: hypothetical protein LBK60_09475 [Verrucomicrobiales bacterium]|jgi:hypothetical protein|nr:hypothetical protein [Verrucomicrobiales bacterium]
MVGLPIYFYGYYWSRTLSMHDLITPMLTDRQRSFYTDDAELAVARQSVRAGNATWGAYRLETERLERGAVWARVFFKDQWMTTLTFAPDMFAAVTVWRRLAQMWREPTACLPADEAWRGTRPPAEDPSSRQMPGPPWGIWLAHCAPHSHSQEGFKEPRGVYDWWWLLVARESGKCGAEAWPAGATPVILPPVAETTVTVLGEWSGTVARYPEPAKLSMDWFNMIHDTLLGNQFFNHPNVTLEQLRREPAMVMVDNHVTMRGEAVSGFMHFWQEDPSVRMYGLFEYNIALTEDAADELWSGEESRMIYYAEQRRVWTPIERPPAPWVLVNDSENLRRALFSPELVARMWEWVRELAFLLLKIRRGEIHMPPWDEQRGWLEADYERLTPSWIREMTDELSRDMLEDDDDDEGEAWKRG